jgi:hypothetical protein
LIELCDSSIELRHWLDRSGKRRQAISGEILDDEICFTKPSVELDPFQTEHEGYTGNAGNAVDRWYHRAAVMLWPRARTFAIRTKASPAWGIRDIARTLARGARDVARQRRGSNPRRSGLVEDVSASRPEHWRGRAAHSERSRRASLGA